MADSGKQRPWLAIALALIAACGTPLVVFTTQLYESKVQSTLGDGNIKTNLEATGKLYSDLFVLCSKTEGSRALLLRAHDSGTVIPSRSTIIAEVSMQSNKALDGWFSQTLDAAYINLLSDVIQQGSIFTVVDDMPDSILRDVNMSLGTNRFYMVHLGVSQGEIYYLSLHWDDEMRELSAMDKNEMRLAIINITRTLKALRVIE